MRRYRSRIRGFSLIEVLIAVAVLSVGLLAIGALQAALVRSSAEAKAQSVALGVGEQQLEQSRAFQNRAEYLALDSVAQASATTTTLGGVQYSVWRDVRRFVYDGSAAVNAFVQLPTANNTSDDATVTALDSDYVLATEFKRVAVMVGWVDANGQSQLIRVSDVLSSMQPSDSARVRAERPSKDRNPKVLVRDPSTTPGVIPIAVGNGAETAATNPRPEIVGASANATIAETRYDVLTYQATNNNLAQVQRRVETSVVACECDFGTAVSGQRAFRPTFWNGTRYVPPTLAPTGTVTAGERSGTNQSGLCTECCRDHHDPSGITGPKFDPRRSTHAHYQVNSGTGVLQAVPSTGNRDYIEACRVIRVDGIMRVASDLYSEHYALLETAALNSQPFPESCATGDDCTANDYENFVIGFMQQRIADQVGSMNTMLSSTAITGLESTNQINSPAVVDLGQNDLRWLHNRGIYLDYLEPEAINKAASAIAAADCTATPRVSCALPFLPFTSINTTELSSYRSTPVNPASPPSNNTIIVVDNTAGTFGSSTLPVMGSVTRDQDAIAGQTANANAQIKASNTGLTATRAIDNNTTDTYPDTAPTPVPDAQLFRVQGIPDASAISFLVRVGGLTFSSTVRTPIVGWRTTSQAIECPGRFATSPNPNPYGCEAGTITGSEVDVIVTRFNQTSTVRVQNPCRNGGPEIDKPVCSVFDVTGVSVTRAGVTTDFDPVADISVTSNGRVGETATFRLSGAQQNDAVAFTLGLSATQPVTTSTCPSTGNDALPVWNVPCL